MHVEAAALAVERSLQGTVLVIGAGPVGLTIAHELADAGIDVIVLDSGPLSHPTLSPRAVRTVREHLIYRGEYPLQHFEIRGVGGGSRAWIIDTPAGGHHVQLAALDESDFSIAPPGFSGWPISYAEYAAYHDRAAQHCGLSGWGPLSGERSWPWWLVRILWARPGGAWRGARGQGDD